MSEDDDDDDDEGDDLDEDGNGTGSSSKVAGVPLAAAQAAASQAKTAAHKFLPPIEVELQMQHLWKHEAGVLDLIFASGKDSHDGDSPASAGDANGASPGVPAGGVFDGYRVFFIRALAVPPPRFRPPMHMGDMIAEHPQNVYLTKVCFRLVT